LLNRQYKIMKLILKLAPQIINLQDNNKWTCMHYASTMDILPVKILLKYGANLNITDNTNETPLFISARHNDVKIFELMCEYAHKDTFYIFNIYGWSCV